MAEHDPGNPTLDSWKQIQPHEVGSEMMGSLIRQMQQTKFHRWGFVIYRCAYSEGDDEAWDYYIKTTYELVRLNLGRSGCDLLLFKYFELILMDDRDKFENATKMDIREHFATLSREHRSIEKGGDGTAPVEDDKIPMFHYCLYVDQKCLDTIQARREFVAQREEDEKARGKPSSALNQAKGGPPVVSTLLDLKTDPEGEGPDGYPEIEGCTREYPGWIYTRADSLHVLYNQLCATHVRGEPNSYVRPPHVDKMKKFAMAV